MRLHGLLPSQLKNRAITLVLARNIFRVFGHKVVRRGRPIRDDYWVGNQKEPEGVVDNFDDDDEKEFGVYDFGKGPAQPEGMYFYCFHL